MNVERPEVRSSGFSPQGIRLRTACCIHRCVINRARGGLKAGLRTLASVLVIFFCPALFADSAPGLIQLFDGTSLHGALESISTQKGVAWDFPAAQGPLVLKPDNISGIRFESALSTNRPSKPTCRFR